MDLSIIIVSWNVEKKLRENLKAIYKSVETQDFTSLGDFSYEVIVVDNNSEDNTVEMIKKEFPQVELVENEANFGFAKANNQILKHVESKYVLLLNPDMLVEKDTVINMFNWMKNNQQASIASCRLMNEKGEIIKHVRRFPSLSDQLAIVLKLPHLFPNILKKYIREDFDYNKASKVDSARGGFMMLNIEALKDLPHNLRSTLPYFDERYFLWFEEVDLCRQVKIAQGEVWYTPVATCIDFVGQSFKQLPRGQAQKIFQDSMLKYFKKWHLKREYWLLKIAWPISSIIVKISEIIKLKTKAKT